MFRPILVLVVAALANGILVDMPMPEPPIENDLNDTIRADAISYRLPNNTKPETYDISIQTWIHNGFFPFTGTVKIGILTDQTPSSNITLHYRQLTINDVKLWTVANVSTRVELDNWYYIPEVEMLIIPTKANLSANTRYTLEISYNGTLRNDLNGFYRSSYINSDGVRRWLATTQFESTNARHGFPCYDEPASKANFTVRMTHDPSYKTISNMPTATATPTPNPDGSVTTVFQTTPPTSTYLIAFIVSDFVYITNINSTNQNTSIFPHRAFTRPNAIHLANLTLDAGEKILNAIANYLDVPFSLPKMDQVAVPDFSPGAMENWGLVTYREERFLYDERVSTYTMQSAIVAVIAHEFGHQWFGNLVGPQWWTYIWLNEGFANFFEHYAVNLVYPEWNYLHLFVINTIQNVMQSDAVDNVRPMTHYEENAGAVGRLFDNIAYAKSGSVIRMFLNAFSEQSFKKGLNYYLNARAFKGAVEEDLFAGFERAVKEDKTLPAHLNVSAIMLSWTRQRGFPVLHVTRNENGTITISQERYLSNTSNTQDQSSWWIPYNFATANNSNFDSTFPDDWLPQHVFSRNINQSANHTWSADDWIVFNKQQSGYYRVKYDEQNYKLIANGLNRNLSRIHVLSRSQIIDDAFNFARTNRLNFSIVLSITSYLQHELEYAPWVPAVNGFSYLNRLLAGQKNYKHFTEYVRNLTEHLFASVGIEDKSDEPRLNKYSRTLVINWACTMGSENCRNRTTNKLKELMQNGQEVHQNIRNVFYCAAIRGSNEEEFSFVWVRMERSKDQEYKNMLISALSCTMNENLLKRYLNTSLNSTSHLLINQFTSSEQLRVFNAAYQSGQLGLQLGMQFLTKNIDEAQRTYGNSSISGIIGGMAQRVVNEERRNEFDTLLEIMRNKNIVSNSTINSANSVIDENLRWVGANARGINSWLADYHGSGSTKFGVSVLAMLAVLASTVLRYLK